MVIAQGKEEIVAARVLGAADEKQRAFGDLREHGERDNDMKGARLRKRRQVLDALDPSGDTRRLRSGGSDILCELRQAPGDVHAAVRFDTLDGRRRLPRDAGRQSVRIEVDKVQFVVGIEKHPKSEVIAIARPEDAQPGRWQIARRLAQELCHLSAMPRRRFPGLARHRVAAFQFFHNRDGRGSHVNRFNC